MIASNPSSDILRPLTLAELKRAAEINTLAFQDDPMWDYILPTKSQRMRLMARTFTALLRFAIRNGEAFGFGDPLAAVAIWNAPNQKTRLTAILGAGFERLLFSRFIYLAPRAFRMLGRVGAMHRRYAPEPHYYLSSIGVAPDSQGKGFASRLIRPFLDRADTGRVGAYLETVTPGNVKIYEHFGFQVKEATTVSGADVTIWALYRPPCS